MQAAADHYGVELVIVLNADTGYIFELDDVTPVALVVILFSLAIAASARAAATIAAGIRLPRGAAARLLAANSGHPSGIPEQSAERSYIVASGITAPSSAIARALETATRRESGAVANRTVVAALRAGPSDGMVRSAPLASPGDPDASTSQRPSYPPSRTRLPRASRAASRRDR